MKMKVLILNGNKEKDPEIDELYDSIVNEMSKRDWETNAFILKEIKIAPCQGCFGCWIQTPGECIIKDYEAEIIKMMVQSDLIIHYTPITFGGYSSELKKVIDRSIPVLLPFFTKVKRELHHKHRYENLPSVIVVGILSHPDEEKEKIFKTLVYRNSINMASPIHEALIHVKGQNPSVFLDGFNKILTNVEAIQ